MPRPRRSNLSRRSRSSQRLNVFRANQNLEQVQTRNNIEQARLRLSRSNLTLQERLNSNREDMLRMRRSRLRTSNQERRRSMSINFDRLAFDYDHSVDLSEHRFVSIGLMNVVCSHCNASKFRKETPGLCCASGQVKLPPLNKPPEPLQSLLSNTHHESRHFLTNIQAYNSCFQMTSFGATNVNQEYITTFRVSIQDNIYGSTI